MEFRIEKRGEIALTGLARRVNCDKGSNFKEIPAIWDECLGNGLVDTLVTRRPQTTTARSWLPVRKA